MDKEILYFYDNGSTEEVGSSSQAELLLEYSDDFIPVSTEGIGGVEENQKIEGHWYPNDVASFVKDFNPDGVLIHSITEDLMKNIGDIRKQAPVTVRMGANPWELWIWNKYTGMVPNLFGFLRQLDGIITPSEGLAKSLNAIGIKNTVSIPTAIDFDAWDKDKVDDSRMVSISRFTPVKNHMSNLMVSANLGQRLPGFQHNIYGTGQSAKVGQQLAGVMGTRDTNIKGYRPANEVLPARCFLQTSLSENGSLSALEACASGTPVVGTSTQGHPASARHHHENIEGIADECYKILTDDDVYETARQDALDYAEARDVEKIMPIYDKLFNNFDQLNENGFKEGK